MRDEMMCRQQQGIATFRAIDVSPSAEIQHWFLSHVSSLRLRASLLGSRYHPESGYARSPHRRITNIVANACTHRDHESLADCGRARSIAGRLAMRRDVLAGPRAAFPSCARLPLSFNQYCVASARAPHAIDLAEEPTLASRSYETKGPVPLTSGLPVATPAAV